ncbi:MAG: hypothetical protein AB9917_19450 [Negativicutes bacterium]
MRLQTFFGYTTAALMLIVAVATFLGLNSFSQKLVSATGLQISPWFSGGEIIGTIDRGSYKTLQHRAVFDALIGQRAEGFVQIDFSPPTALPDQISQDVDFDLDGKIDFHLEYDVPANTAVLTAYNPRVVDLAGCYVLKERRAVRVRLSNALNP